MIERNEWLKRKIQGVLSLGSHHQAYRDIKVRDTFNFLIEVLDTYKIDLQEPEYCYDRKYVTAIKEIESATLEYKGV